MSKEAFSENEKTIGRREVILGLSSALALAACDSRNKLFAMDREDKGVGMVDDRLEVRGDPKQVLVEHMKQFPGLKWIGKLEGNGDREVVIFMPIGTDMNEPVELIYHFHGTHGHLINERIPHLKVMSGKYKESAGTTSAGANRIRQVIEASDCIAKEGRNIVIVYPLSAGPRPSGSFAHRNGYDDLWMRKGASDNMDQLHQEIRRVIKDDLHLKMIIGQLTIKGHSAGGRALQHVAESGFKVDRIDYLDASYPGWAPRCYEAAIKTNPDLEMNIFYKKGRDTDDGSVALEGKKGVFRIPKKFPHRLMNIKYFGWMRKGKERKKSKK